MNNGRLEAFSDGLMAVLIMVLFFRLSPVAFVTGWMGENRFALPGCAAESCA